VKGDHGNWSLGIAGCVDGATGDWSDGRDARREVTRETMRHATTFGDAGGKDAPVVNTVAPGEHINELGDEGDVIGSGVRIGANIPETAFSPIGIDHDESVFVSESG